MKFPKRKPRDVSTVPRLVTVDATDILQLGGTAWSATSSALAINAAARDIVEHGPDAYRWPGAPEGAQQGEKAFIFGVWKRFFESQIPLDQFKDLLRELHSRRLLELSRFDLVPARGTTEGYEITRLSTTPIWKNKPDAAAHWNFIRPSELKQPTKKGRATGKHNDTQDQAAVKTALLATAARHHPGTLLLIEDIRKTTSLPKKRFDAAVMELSRAGGVVLHHHDHPMALSAAARKALVWSPKGSSDLYKGTYYIGIAPRSQDVGEQVRAAYLRLTGGKANKYVRLAPLRAELAGIAREAVDAALIKLQQRDEAVLYPIDDPQRLRAEDNAAALRVSGERRDLFLLRP